MVVVPEEMPRTIPVADPTVPTARLLELHVPPAVALASVDVLVAQIVRAPVIEAGVAPTV
jgi:cell division septation protein DedD